MFAVRVVVYRNRPSNERGVNCSGNYTLYDEREQFCDFEISDLEADPEFDCTRENSYGYHNNKPCVLLKINKVRMSLCFNKAVSASGC